jgi:hypothetical protein
MPGVNDQLSIDNGFRVVNKIAPYRKGFSHLILAIVCIGLVVLSIRRFPVDLTC